MCRPNLPTSLFQSHSRCSLARVVRPEPVAQAVTVEVEAAAESITPVGVGAAREGPVVQAHRDQAEPKWASPLRSSCNLHDPPLGSGNHRAGYLATRAFPT